MRQARRIQPCTCPRCHPLPAANTLRALRLPAGLHLSALPTSLAAAGRAVPHRASTTAWGYGRPARCGCAAQARLPCNARVTDHGAVAVGRGVGHRTHPPSMRSALVAVSGAAVRHRNAPGPTGGSHARLFCAADRALRNPMPARHGAGSKAAGKRALIRPPFRQDRHRIGWQQWCGCQEAPSHGAGWRCARSDSYPPVD
jgi:hypothetical protein